MYKTIAKIQTKLSTNPCQIPNVKLYATAAMMSVMRSVVITRVSVGFLRRMRMLLPGRWSFTVFSLQIRCGDHVVVQINVVTSSKLVLKTRRACQILFPLSHTIAHLVLEKRLNIAKKINANILDIVYLLVCWNLIQYRQRTNRCRRRRPPFLIFATKKKTAATLLSISFHSFTQTTD